MIMRIKLLCLFLLASIGLSAQVVFQDLKWDDAVKKAKAEGKPIFVDVCKSSSVDKLRDEVYKTVFVDEEISELMNNSFINIKMDMSSEEGNAFAPKLYSLMYPCMVFYSSNEDQMEVTSAYELSKDKSKLISAAKLSIEKSKVKSQNSRQILFSHITFDEAIIQAKEQNKLIFIDAYTSWCRPCAEMLMNVFNLNNVADFYNANFINLKLDFFKDYPQLAKQYEVHGYPSFLFIDKDAKLVNMESGYTEAEKFISYGQDALNKYNGITFSHLSLDEAIIKAKEENKMVFIDCYTSWCGPCKTLAKEVFTQKTVGDFFNRNYISIKLDMEKEGKSLKQFLSVNVFPTLVFLDSNKQIIHKVVGSMEASELLTEANLAKDGKGVSLYEKKFAEGERDATFLVEYLNMLDRANQKETIKNVIKIYFEGVDKKDLISETNWLLLKKYVTDYKSREFNYLVSNKDKFIKLYGENDINNKIFSVVIVGANSFLKSEGDVKSLDKQAYDKYMKYVKSNHKSDYEKVKFYSELNNSFELNDWTEYVSLVSEVLKTKTVETGDMSVYNWALRVSQACKDVELRKIAAQWAIDASKTSQYFKDAFLNVAKELQSNN